MFGRRYFGARHFGPRYFGDGTAAVAAVPVSTGQSFTPRRNLRRERLSIAIRIEVPFAASVTADIRARGSVAVAVVVLLKAQASLRHRIDIALDVEAPTAEVSGNVVVYDEAEELAVLGYTALLDDVHKARR